MTQLVGYEALWNGNYELAYTDFAQAAASKEGDSSNIGAPLWAGVALLGLKRFDEAKQYFANLISNSLYRVSHHRIYLGLAHWAEGEDIEAIAHWRKALQKCQYARSGGLDIHFTLAHASACRPDLLPRNEVTKGIEKHLTTHKTGFCCRIAEYLIGRITESEVQSKAREEGGNFAAQLVRSNLAMLEFAQSTMSLYSSDLAGFRQHLKTCADVTDCPDMLFEVFFSRLECDDLDQRLARHADAVSMDASNSSSSRLKRPTS